MADIVIQLLPHILAAFGYAALGFHFWNTRWRETSRTAPTGRMTLSERAVIGGVLALHAVLLQQGIFAGSTMRFSFSLALSLILFLAVLIYWLESFHARMDGLQPLVLPLAAVATAVSYTHLDVYKRQLRI